MIVIYAEKPDVGTKIAAALDAIHLNAGGSEIRVSFEELSRKEGLIKKQRHKDGYFRIRYSGDEAVVTWGYGHLCTLKQAYDMNPEWKSWSKLPLPFIPEEYGLKVIKGAESQFLKVKQLFQQAERIICATDNDREGDLIFDYVYQMSGAKAPFQRALFDSQTKDEFQKAFRSENLVGGTERLPVIYAGRARSAGDFLVGSGLTAAMTLKYPGSGVLSVGRVQTAVLHMIFVREEMIRNFKPEDYYVVQAQFTRGNGEQYIGTHTKKKFKDRKAAEEIYQHLLSGDRTGIVTERKDEKSKRGKPYLYNLSTLQVDANKKYGFTLDQTLEIAQALYEKGYTTYPRTDSMHLTEDMGGMVRHVLRSLFQTSAYAKLEQEISISTKNRHYFDDRKVESHFAIIPTGKPVKGLSDSEWKIYDLIARVFICMVYPDAVLGKTRILTEVDGEPFLTTGTTVLEPGFFQVIGFPRETLIPTVKTGEEMTGTKFRMETKQTTPPNRYTDATLLNAMKTCGKEIEDEELRSLMAGENGSQMKGLGRPSSQASIVNTLSERGYIERKGKTIFPTKKGMQMIRCFPVEDLKSAAMTAQWEKRLDEIEKGKDTYDQFMCDLENNVRIWTKQVMDAVPSQEMAEATWSGYLCPICHSRLKDVSWGYACSSTECDFKVSKMIAKKKISETQMKKLLTSGATDYISGFHKANGDTFSARLVVDKEKQQVCFQSYQISETLHCPKCGKPLLITANGYSCTGYRDTGCDFMLSQVGGKRFTEEQVEMLLSGKRVIMRKLKNKKGNVYDAYLSLSLSGPDCGKLNFEFPKAKR